MYNYYLNIGTNLGNRRVNLNRAIKAIEAVGDDCTVSSVIESEPWGYDSTRRFLNVGVMVRSAMQPLDMLHWLKALEKQLGSAAHRDARGGYVDRLVDIDIMAIDRLVEPMPEAANPDSCQFEAQGMIIDTPELTVPHRHLMERPFFVEPLRQLNPHWTHPVTGTPLPAK